MRRFCGSKKGFAVVLLLLVAVCWLALYLSSLYQRRRAQRLVGDLKAFPFATADFAQVRDFVVLHGGGPAQEPSLLPPFGCAASGCELEIWLGYPFSRPPVNQRLWQSVYPSLPFFGLRPWAVYARFEVQNGVLVRSTTIFGQIKRNDWSTYDGLLTVEYSVHTERAATRPVPSGSYMVTTPHVTGPPTEALQSWVQQTSDAPMNSVFDIDLRCFTSIFHGCSNVGALAPSAWQRRQQARQ